MDSASPVRPVAVVTGGSRGIGREIVLGLARAGYDVGFCYQSDEAAAIDVLVTVAETSAASVHAYRADVADYSAVQRFLMEAENDLGVPGYAVASAGITLDNTLAAMKPDDWNRVMSTNLTGMFNLCQQVVFAMIKRRFGSIVTMSSVAGVFGNAGQTNYSASKAGIVGFTKSLAKEVGRFGIRANAVVPGYIVSDLSDKLSAEKQKAAVEKVALKRFGTASEVADLVTFLLSDRARYITGSVMHVDGGISL